MSTITRELAKLFRKITNSEIDAEGNAHVVLSPADSLLINNARIALASLEAEPVAYMVGTQLLENMTQAIAYKADTALQIKPLYTAPSAPVTTNPVAATRAAKSEVRRSRLTADEYLKIYQAAESSPCWLRLAMELAVVTGQRVGDLCEMKWSDIVDGYLYVEQSKTGVKIAIPTALHVDALGISMKETLDKCKEILGGETIIASTRREPLSSGTVSRYFMRARKASGLSFEGDPPTFHELRSLSARLYEKQISDKFAQHLLGHKSDTMASQYRDDRGREWDKIEIK